MATPGQQLKAAREAKGISEQAAGAATRILSKIIVAMEADDYAVIAAPAYARGFIRLYARYLGLNPEPLVSEYNARYAPGPKPLPEAETDLAPAERPPAPVRRLFPDPSAGINAAAAAPARELRRTAIRAALALAVLVLLISAVNWARRRAAERAVNAPPPAPRSLLDRSLPELYLVEPGKIESSAALPAKEPR
jgi:hypothetical protein